MVSVASTADVRPDAGVSWQTVPRHSSSARHCGQVARRVVHGCTASETAATSRAPQDAERCAETRVETTTATSFRRRLHAVITDEKQQPASQQSNITAVKIMEQCIA